MFKKIIYILLYFILTLTSFANPCDNKILKVGWEDWPPYQYRDQNNQITGLDIELIQHLAKAANCKIKLIERPWKRQLA
ncbi:substrate-binding periplasmic protein [Piscirickettsia litoralis]|uniref:Solute-binding protein family 3/N-terminal domain-containing protein n=1 Tax=Piscirickettsia litoralis TaxID=1891921 RepID=A0ABX2ZZZ8_9GAMM|nr:transporter substrate-binding domain-containing protein [Piscirickettsia litoralis]ODN42191.1 hypothetical protein BGC07_03615 [Piscirickettsia litoralis]